MYLCVYPQLQRVSEESPELLAQSTDLLVGVAAQFANSSQRIAQQATKILVTLGNGFTKQGQRITHASRGKLTNLPQHFSAT